VSGIVVGISRFLTWFLTRIGVRRAIHLGRAMGLLVFYLLPLRRSVVLGNLAQAFPEKTEAERWRIARQVYRQLGRVLAETFLLPTLTDADVAALVRLRNPELLDNALAAGKGVIFCLGHMGNWELLGCEGHRKGYDVYAVTRQLRGELNKRLHEARRKVFKELPSKRSFEQGLEVLGHNAALALVIDQHQPGQRAVIVDFFGRPAATSPSPALFSLRSGAPVLTGWMMLGPDDTYDVWVRGPYPVPEAATLEERIQLHTQWLAKDLEAFIREHPAEWYWVHRRWKVPETTAVPDFSRAPPPLPLPREAREEAA
jgi:KDO2-lipid IV(A) lauroyltransferase